MAENLQESDSGSPQGVAKKLIVACVAVIAFGLLFYFAWHFLSFAYLAQVEAGLKGSYQQNPWLAYLSAFVLYALITGLSVPGAAAMTLMYGWFFGFWRALVLVSFASTTGATIAFLLSRYLFRDWIRSRFGERLETFNKSLEKDGPYYLFVLRLVPAFPFFVINAVMGLTPIKTWTFWWVSQLGMLAGTVVYVYAGSRVPDLQTLEAEGVKAIFSGSQLLQLFTAFALLGLFPLVVKKLVSRFSDVEPEEHVA